jgi:LPPG:FO 2-phospho-L-lactate transferase
MGTVVALAGQVGGAKLADGLYRLRGRDLAVIVNTGDDYEQVGLAFCPDLDTMVLTLAGLASPTAGWEPAGESYSTFGMVKTLGGPDRLPFGDKSLAAPLLRAQALRAGRRLTEITLEFCQHLGIDARVLPMSDDPVRTHVLTEEGAIPFHDYFSQLACEPILRGFQYAGASDARIAEEVMAALYAPDLEAIVICPSNPYHCIRPILEVNGMKALLRSRGVPIVAVTPIVGGKALKGSAGKMMRELGREVSARGVAMEYYKLIDGFVIDAEDEAIADGILASGIEVMMAHTVMSTVVERVALARTVLNFARAIRAKRSSEETLA